MGSRESGILTPFACLPLSFFPADSRLMWERLAWKDGLYCMITGLPGNGGMPVLTKPLLIPGKH
jgi:hypothetical protein